MAKEKQYITNEKLVAKLLGSIPELHNVQRHPQKHSGYDIGGHSDINFTKNDPTELWKTPYYDESVEGVNIAVEVKDRGGSFYKYWILEKEKALNMHAQVQKERPKKGTIPLYCVSCLRDGKEYHYFYDVRWIVETHKVTDGEYNDQTIFNNEDRQGVKIKKEVYKFEYDNYIFKFVDGMLEKGDAYECN